jgi:hypothetical protein
MNTTIDLLDCIRAHLAAFELPPIASVHVMPHTPEVTVQLARHETLDIAAALLAWADTLTGISAEAWRIPQGDSIHLSVTATSPTLSRSESSAV